MDDHKYLNFRNEHPGARFADLNSVPAGECSQILSQFKAKLGLAKDVSSLETLLRMRARAVPIHLKAVGIGYNIGLAVGYANLGGAEKLLINWGRFDRIDEISAVDFVRFFEYLWYPGADDLEFFDPELNNVLIIDHDGHLSALNFDETK